MSERVRLLRVGQTFKCGSRGSITGKIVKASRTNRNDLHEDTDPEYCGYIYVLNKDVTVFKRVTNGNWGHGAQDWKITIELLIPAHTLIRAGFQTRDEEYADDDATYKCRAARALVQPYSEYCREHPGFSSHDIDFKYHPGELIKPTEPFDMNPSNQCSSGIHFFFEKERANRW